LLQQDSFRRIVAGLPEANQDKATQKYKTAIKSRLLANYAVKFFSN
jgi:hypothetical protein